MANEPTPVQAPAPAPAALPPTSKDVERYLSAVAEYRELSTRQYEELKKKIEELIARGAPLPPVPAPEPKPKKARDTMLDGWDS